VNAGQPVRRLDRHRVGDGGADVIQRVLVIWFHVDEVDVRTVDAGRELRERVQSRLAPAPVVAGAP
jgi:hypothetical protein